jgi:hypothetical protein
MPIKETIHFYFENQTKYINTKYRVKLLMQMIYIYHSAFMN